MIQTISQPDFAQKIIFRYISGAQGYLSAADLLLMRERKENEAERPLARSIQNIYLIQRAITENTVYNLNIHLNFLHILFNKTVRELHESTARHIGMLEKRAEQSAQVPPASNFLRSGPAFSPNPFRSDFSSPPTVLEARQNREDTLSLVFNGKPDSVANIEKTSKSQRTDHADDGTKTVQAVQSAAQTKMAEADAQTAGNVASPLNQELLPKTILNMPLWIRKLWHIESVKSALIGENIALTFPQIWQREIVAVHTSEQTRASWTSLMLNGNMPVLPSGQTSLRDHANETHSDVFFPKLPGLSHITPTDAAGVEQIEAPHIMSRTHPAPIQPDAQQGIKGKESSRIQRPLSKFSAASDMTLMHQTNIEHINRTPQSSTENSHAAETSKQIRQGSNSGKATSIAHRTVEPVPIPYPSTAQNSWSNKHHTDENQNAEVKMLQKIWSYRSVPRQDAKTDLNGVLFTEAHAPLFHGDRSHTSAIDQRLPAHKGAKHAFIPKITGESREIPVSANALPEILPIRSITSGVRNIPPNRKSDRASYGMPLIPAIQARTMQKIEVAAPFYAAQPGPSQVPAYSTSNQAKTSAALTQPQASRAGQAKTGVLSATLASGAVIVHRKESSVRQEPPPVPPSVSHDIEFIKKTVKQSHTSIQPQKANIAVNLPASAAHASVKQEADTLRDIERQAAVIADKVYNTLERRLRSEQMRKGLL